MRVTRWLFLALVALLLAVPASALAQTPSLRGTVTYNERLSLPAGAVLRVELLDVTQAGVVTPLVQQNIDVGGKAPPYNFDLSYNPVRILPGGTYIVRAQITVQNARVFETPNQIRVLTPGNPTQVSITLQRTSVNLPNTSGGGFWLLIGLLLLVAVPAVHLLRRSLRT